MFTPRELQEKTFDKAVFGGYDMQMVDEFLEPLIQDYTTLYKENSVLKSKLKILVEKLEEYRAQEISMKKALVAAQQTSDSIIAEAQKKASRILNDAEETVGTNPAAMQQEYEAERRRVEEAAAAAQGFIEAIEQDVQRHLELLASLKTLQQPKLDAAPVIPAAAPKAEPVVEAAPEVPAEPVTQPEPEAAPVQSAPVAAPVSEEEDLFFQIGSAVQEIVAEEVGAAPAPAAGRSSGVRFEDLQFGKDYSFTK